MISACSSIFRRSHQRCCHNFASITSLPKMKYYEEEDSIKRKQNMTINVQRQRRRHLSTNNKSVVHVLSKEAATAPIDYPTSQRFSALPPAIGIHLAIGSVYVYSMWTPGMSKALGKRIRSVSSSLCSKDMIYVPSSTNHLY